MQQSIYLPESSENWDTNWARNYLKISEDQLRKLESIPEWLPVANEKKSATVEEISACVLLKEPLLQGIVPENLNKDNPVQNNRSSKSKKREIIGAHMDSDLDISCSYSQPEMGSYKSVPVFPKPLEKLGANILNHKFLKPPIPISNLPEKEVLLNASSKAGEEIPANPKLFGTKTNIPCVEMSEPADEVESGNKTSKEVLKDVEVIAVVEENRNDKLVVEFNEEMSNSKMGSSANVVDDSYRCESIPCGQPVNIVDDPSPPPIDSSGKIPNIQEEGLEKEGASAAPQTPEEAKSGSPHAESSGIKRKHKSKGDTPKQKDAKRPRNLNITFTSDQVKHMLEILRLNHSK